VFGVPNHVRAMAIKLPSYLHRNRHGVFGFRVVMPQHLRLLFPAREYRVSLHTTDKKQARQIALSLAGFTQDRFRKMSGQEDNCLGAEFSKGFKLSEKSSQRSFFCLFRGARFLASGMSESDIARKLAVARQTVATWEHRMGVGG